MPINPATRALAFFKSSSRPVIPFQSILPRPARSSSAGLSVQYLRATYPKRCHSAASADSKGREDGPSFVLAFSWVCVCSVPETFWWRHYWFGVRRFADFLCMVGKTWDWFFGHLLGWELWGYGVRYWTIMSCWVCLDGLLAERAVEEGILFDPSILVVETNAVSCLEEWEWSWGIMFNEDVLWLCSTYR